MESPASLIEWAPFPGPQREAYDCEADELFYGGAAGGGKTDLLLGLGLTAHRKSIIFRREYPQLRGIIERAKEIIGERARHNANDNLWRLPDGRLLELGAVQHEDDKQRFQGRPHDFKAFDELPHFTRSQYQFLIAWNRTDRRGQRVRVVAAGNPPVEGQEGAWIFEDWGPWLDPKHPDPAAPGELRWYAWLDDELCWFRSGDAFEHTDRRGKTTTVRPRSRTFIRALVDDNPVYMETGYDALLESLPEPMRSQLRYGDFAASAEDDPWQVIPTAWVVAAQKRWRGSERPDLRMTTLGVDVARGGKDKTVLAPRYGAWFAMPQKHPGAMTRDGQAVAGLVAQALGSESASINIDPLSVGTSPLDILRENQLPVNPINFGAGAKDGQGNAYTDKSKKYTFRNVRAWAYWRLREALDPQNGENLCLPDDRELLADLCAPRYQLYTSGIGIESKEDIRARIGRSPDVGDAVVLANLPGIIPGKPRAIRREAPAFPTW